MPQKETCKCHLSNQKDDIFASFFVFETKFENAMPILWITATEDNTGNIVLIGNGEIELEAGDYAVVYSVSAVLETAGYMQIMPFYNQTAHLPFGAYFKNKHRLCQCLWV